MTDEQPTESGTGLHQDSCGKPVSGAGSSLGEERYPSDHTSRSEDVRRESAPYAEVDTPYGYVSEMEYKDLADAAWLEGYEESF